MPEPKDTLAELLIAETLNRMDGKLDKLDDRIDGVDKTLVLQSGILAEHVRRTDLLEKKIDADIASSRADLPKHIDEHLKTRAQELSEKRQKRILFALKVGGGIAGLSTGGWGLTQIVKWLAGLVS